MPYPFRPAAGRYPDTDAIRPRYPFRKARGRDRKMREQNNTAPPYSRRRGSASHRQR